VIEELSRGNIRRNVEKFRGERFCVEAPAPWVARRKVLNVERLPGEPVTVLLFDRQIHAPSATRYSRFVRRIETHQAVQEAGTVELGFDPAIQRLIVHGVSIFRSGTLVNHAAEDAFELFQRESGLESGVLTGAVTALLVIKDLRVGDVLDVEFSVVGDGGVFGDHYWCCELVENTYSIGRQWLSWIERDGQELFVQSKWGDGEVELTHHGRVRTWQFERTPIVKLEPNMPAAYRPFGEISITTFSSWGEVSAMFLSAWNREPADRSQLDQELERLRGRFAADELSGIEAAVDLVRNQVRYLGYSPGVFALIPAPPDEVWSLGFGDCKEKSRLLVWFLKELGLVAEPVLVHTVIGEEIGQLSPGPGAFNHVVVRLRWMDVDYWIDPTDVARGGSVAQWLGLPYHYGLPLSGGSASLVPIPSGVSPDAGLEVEEVIRADAKSRAATIAVTHVYRGGEADAVRHLVDSRGVAALDEYIVGLVKQVRRDAYAQSELVMEDDRRANVITLRKELRCDELLKPTATGDADVVFLLPYSIPPRITGVPASLRKFPLGIQHPVNVKHVIRLNMDAPKLVRIPPTAVKNAFFYFSFVTVGAKTESIHTFKFQTLASQVPAAQVPAYSKDLDKISEAFDWHVRLPPRNSGGKFRRVVRGPESW